MRTALIVAGVVAGIVVVGTVIAKRNTPVIGGKGYPAHQTTWGEAFKIAFLGAKYPTPINVPVGADGTRTVNFMASVGM